MPIYQDRGVRPSSAADPLPTPAKRTRFSAVAQLGQIGFKRLISNRFLTFTGLISGAKAHFTAVDSGIATGSPS